MDGGQSAAPDVRPGARTAPGLSAAALDRRFGLRRRAREDAARNLPRPDATELSAAELAVIEAVAAERARIDQARSLAKADAERRACARSRPRRRTSPAQRSTHAWR
jgi:hypothetical protein